MFHEISPSNDHNYTWGFSYFMARTRHYPPPPPHPPNQPNLHSPHPKTMKGYKPIFLCNVLYKIISKTLANRLEPLLQKCISSKQSTFVEGRSILDNTLIAFEFIHHMKCKTKWKTREMTLNIDINKAFDRVQWNYILRIMQKMGFHMKWIRWMKLCLELVHYSI